MRTIPASVASMALILALAIPACGGDEVDEEMERARKAAGEAMEKAGEAAGHAGKAAGAAAEKAMESARDAAEKAEEKSREAMAAAEEAMDDAADEGGCLDQVRQGRFSEAMDVCREAIRADPDDERLQAALDKAKRMSEDAAEAADDAVEKAGDLLDR